MQQTLKTNALIFTALLISISLAACGGKEVESTGTPKVRPAKLVTVTAASTSRELSFPAVIEDVQSSEMTFQVGGQITTLTVLEGQEVRKGKIIARVEQRDYQNTLAQAKAQFDNAETEYQRAQRLADQDAISRSVLETRRTSRDVAKAVLDSAEKSTGDTILRAPFDGYIAKVYVEKFQNIQAKEPIALIQSGKVKAVINTPADIVARSLQFEPSGTNVVLDAAPGLAIPAIFQEASGQANPTTQTYEISFSFDVPENIIALPGMTATLNTSFTFNSFSDIVPTGIALPVSAVMAEGENRYIWKVDRTTMQISKSAIVTGMGIDQESVIVISGVNNGDLVVAAGGSFMHEGMKVRAWQPK